MSRVFFEPLRTLSASEITADYVAVGDVLKHAPRFFKIVNATDGDVIVSLNSSVEAGNMIFPPNSFTCYDIQSNQNTTNETSALISSKTQFFAKVGNMVPTSGNFYIEVMF